MGTAHLVSAAVPSSMRTTASSASLDPNLLQGFPACGLCGHAGSVSTGDPVRAGAPCDGGAGSPLDARGCRSHLRGKESPDVPDPVAAPARPVHAAAAAGPADDKAAEGGVTV